MGALALPGVAAAQGGPARVDLLLPLTATNEEVRQEARGIADGARLAVEEAPGGRAALELKVSDTRGVAETAAAAAREARSGGARLILGPLFAAEAKAVGQAAPELPIVSFSNDRSVGRRGVYVAGFQPETEVGAIAGFAREAGFGPVSVFGPAGALDERVRAALARDGDLQIAGAYAPGEVEAAARRFVGDLVSRRPAVTPVVYLTAPVGELAPAAEALSGASRVQGPLQLAGGAAMAEAVERSGGRLVGVWWAAADPAARRGFADRFRARFGRPPERLAGLGYDGAYLAATLAAGARITPAEVERSNGFLGVDGLFRFDPDGVVERALAVVQSTPGGPYVLKPAARAFAR